MGLELIDFVSETEDVDLEDFPPEVQSRINDALADLTGGEGGPSNEPKDPPQSIIVSENPDGELEYRSIQEAINNAATSGDVIFVEAGEYDEDVTINVSDLTLEGPNAAVPGDEDENRGTEATIEGLVDVSADNVRVRGFSVSPAGDFTEKPAAGILINGSYSEVENNIVEGIRGDGSVSVHGVQIFKQSPERLEDITVSDNLIRDIDNGGGEEWPNYDGAIGIKVQNQLDGVTVTNNTIEDVYSKGWTYGVVSTPSSDDTVQPQDVTITNNTIDAVGNGDKYAVSDVIGSAPYRGTAVGLDTNSGEPEANPTADAGELTVNQNNFGDVPVGVLNKDGSANLDATNNWWGDVAGPDSSQVKQAPTSDFGPVRTSPHLDAPFDEGGQPVYGGAFVSPGPNLLDTEPNGSYEVDVVEESPSGQDLDVHITSGTTPTDDYGTSAVRLGSPPTLGDVDSGTTLTYDYYEGPDNSGSAPDEVWLLLEETDGTTHVVFNSTNDNTSGESLETRNVAEEITGNNGNWNEITGIGARESLDNDGDLAGVYPDNTEIVAIAAARGSPSQATSDAVADVYYGKLNVAGDTLEFPGR